MKVKSVRWDITGACNLSCNHCQASKYYRNNKSCKDLTTEESFKVIEELSKCNVDKVGILGGEPLLRSDIIDILKGLKKKNIRVSLNTNATLVEKFDVDEILNNVETVVVSIDGINQKEHDKLRGIGSFDKTILNTKKLVKHKTKQLVGVSLVFNKYNYKSANEISAFMNGLNVDFCMVDVVHETGNAEDYWEDLGLTNDQVLSATQDLINGWDFNSKTTLIPRMYSNKFRDLLFESTGINLNNKFVCDAPGISSLYILNDGTVLPSQFLAYSKKSRPFRSLSLKEYSLEDIVKCDDFVEFLELYELRLYENYYEPCNSCKYSGKECNPSPLAYWLDKKIPIPVCTLSEESKSK